MNRMKELREELNISKAQVARDLNMAYTTYVNYEKETREPNSEVLILVANYFHVSVDYLIGRTDIKIESTSAPTPEVTDIKQTQLLSNFNQLNDTGKTRLLEYSDDLVTSGKYSIPTKNQKRA